MEGHVSRALEGLIGESAALAMLKEGRHALGGGADGVALGEQFGQRLFDAFQHVGDEAAAIAAAVGVLQRGVVGGLGALDEGQLKSLEKFGPKKILKNYAGLVTGESAPVFELRTT